MGPRHFKQSEDAPEQEGTGEERSRNSAGKETKRQGRRQGRKEQSTPPCRPSRDAIVSQLEFWWWDVWRAGGRKLVPGWQSSQMYDVPVRQAPGKTVCTVLTRQGEGRTKTQELESNPGGGILQLVTENKTAVLPSPLAPEGEL